MNKENITKNFIIGTFVTLYFLVSCISTIHVIDFFSLSNPKWLAISLAIAFEIGAAASLASIIALKKMNKGIVWLLFFILTFMQAMGNTYYAYTHLANYQYWVELFGLVDNDIIEQKRILSLVSGAILPLVALGFIKSLVDYIKPDDEQQISDLDKTIEPLKTVLDDEAIIKAGEEAKHRKVMKKVRELQQKRIDNGETFDDEPSALAFTKYEVEDEEDEEEVKPEQPTIQDEPEPMIENKKDDLKNKILGQIRVFENGNNK